MRKIIYKNCKNSKIIPIKPHKLGPIHAITKIKNYLNLDESVVVNYCDFTCIIGIGGISKRNKKL